MNNKACAVGVRVGLWSEATAALQTKPEATMLDTTKPVILIVDPEADLIEPTVMGGQARVCVAIVVRCKTVDLRRRPSGAVDTLPAAARFTLIGGTPGTQ
jgi:hypothetical protein